MIIERISYDSLTLSSSPHIMMRSSSPETRASSPAVSEISVGSPSPPPHQHPAARVNLHHHLTAFRPLNMKRMRFSSECSQSPTTNLQPQQQQPPLISIISPALPTTYRKSSAERVKSFSIADILGKKDDRSNSPIHNSTEAAVAPPPLPSSSATHAATCTMLPTTPTGQHLLCERLQAPSTLASKTPHTLPHPPHQAPVAALTKVVHPWDAAAAAAAVRGPIPIRPFFPPALLHYEQRLAWDYQRQLQEHFQAQAQLLRQMSMDPTIIPSEDGSERSRSSSTGSGDCCSPEVHVSNGSANGGGEGGDDDNKSSNRDPRDDDRNGAQQKSAVGESNKKVGTTAADTPLDALFQLSTKNFDEEQDPATLSIFQTRPNPKKKRKSRTAFTNHQIFELEKRFLYQKYLSPADRDEIAAGLGLSNAQVITWFQNRRAKLKRDMEELKKDVESVKQLHDQSAELTSSQQQQLQRLQQQRQHIAATLNLQQTHAIISMPTSYPPHSHAQQQHSQHALPLTLMEVEATATALQQRQQQQHQQQALAKQQQTGNINNNRVTTNSTAAEDKKELKILKMMTLMYYSSRSSSDEVTTSSSNNALKSVGNTGSGTGVRCIQGKLRSN